MINYNTDFDVQQPKKHGSVPIEAVAHASSANNKSCVNDFVEILSLAISRFDAANGRKLEV